MQFLEYGSSIPAEDERMTDIGENIKEHSVSHILTDLHQVANAECDKSICVDIGVTIKEFRVSAFAH